ncbi:MULTISPECIES: hypothetical protein [unclassified Gilliamella]|uniref:hypothetical protein n=1 Tax=unclassified Gilliamella TaxID=2685620 RepID=UPI00080E38F3|nr:hypothetical protein [Gilliamella apicola]OCG35695.1 hypothetical protein A9G32_06395 [Gilliamella apicola]OCG48555.1 hypothetical protein A9G27_00350 [Gilliamella apicola]OCG52919.1 hypothetical protein A9G26_12250 [Gilliamella apicola]
MITDEEWKKLKSGDVIWYADQHALKPQNLIIVKITKNSVYCDKKKIDKESYLLHSSLNDATQAVNFRLKAHIEKIQHQIDENLKQLEQENGN